MSKHKGTPGVIVQFGGQGAGIEQIKLLVRYTTVCKVNATYVEWQWGSKMILGCWSDVCSVRVQPRLDLHDRAWFYGDQPYSGVAIVPYDWESHTRIPFSQHMPERDQGADLDFGRELGRARDLASTMGTQFLQRQLDKLKTPVG